MKKRLIVLIFGLLVASSSITVVSGEGAFEPKGLYYETVTEEVGFTLSEIENMSDSELEELHLLPINSIGLQSVDTYYYVPSYNVKQINNFYCGPAATLQMIRVATRASNVSGSTDAAKQRTLAGSSYLGTDRDGATWINNVSKTLNHFIPRNRNWTQSTININDQSTLFTMSLYTRSNFIYDNAVTFLLFPGALSYYPDSNRSGHYISASAIIHHTNSPTDFANIDLRLNDPHYDDKYFGTHTEKFLRVAQGMHNYSTSRGPANFVY